MTRSSACDAVREALSALADGEAAPLAEPVIERHLARCHRCAEYGREVARLSARLGLSALEDVPNAAPAALASTLPATWRRATVWALPLGALAAVLPAAIWGTFGHIHLDPSHLVTPCTHGLRPLSSHLAHRALIRR